MNYESGALRNRLANSVKANDPKSLGAGDAPSPAKAPASSSSLAATATTTTTTAKPRRPQWAHYAELSTWEFAFYLICACASIGYACYRVFRMAPTTFRMFANHRALKIDADPDFERPSSFWRNIGPVRDATNHEWTVLVWLFQRSVVAYGVHVLLSAVLRHFRFSPRSRLFVLGVWCCVSFSRIVGTAVVASFYVYGFLGLCIARVTKHVASQWVFSVFALTLLNFPEGVPYMNGFSAFRLVFDDNDYVYEHYFIWVITLAQTLNRTTSFSHEFIKRNFRSVDDSAGSPQSFLTLAVDLFNYIYYLPLLVTGPMMTYDRFEDDLRAVSPEYRRQHPDFVPPTYLRLSLDRDNLTLIVTFLARLLRLAFWFFVTEAIVHRAYFGILFKKIAFLRSGVDLWELAGIGYCNGQFFYLKYLQMYGIHSLIAHFDGMTPAKQPKCISRVYLYSDMFRNFDTGLHSFIKRHLYIPLGGSHHGFFRQLLTSGIVYFFIYFWHGSEYYIVLWTAINFSTINLETAGLLLWKKPWVKSMELKMGPRMWRRFRVMLSVPLFVASTFGIFMFIGSTEDILYVYLQRFFVEGASSGGLYLALFCMYCIAQCSVTFSKREERHLVPKSE